MQGRINKELSELSNNPPDNCVVSLVGDSTSEWRVDIEGPRDSPYEGGRFQVLITIPSNYPFKPPDARFATKIYHPSVKSDDGAICAQVYQDNWSPTKSIRHIIDLVMNMLLTPNPDHPVEADIASQMANDYNAFAETARQWVQQYAQ